MFKDDKIDNENEDAKGEGFYKPIRPRTRVSPVDFMRVEDTMHGCPLTHFELSVKEKIACAPSPSSELMEREDQERRIQEVRNTLAALVQNAKFTQRQKVCYELIYLEGFSDREAAEYMRLSEVRIRRLKLPIFKALKRARERMLIVQKASLAALTKRQKLLIDLRYEKLLPVKEIAKKLNVTESAVKKLLQKSRQKIFSKEKFPKSPPS